MKLQIESILEEQMMSVVKLGLLKDRNMCCILPDDQQIASEGWLFASKYKYKKYGIL